MSQKYYSEINLHFNCHTKENLPLITARVEPFLHRYLKEQIANTPGLLLHEIGGTENHLHLAVTVPPTLLISEFVGQLKGASAHETNEQVGRGDKILQWQTGYGVVSFGTRDLDWVTRYIRDQKEHHSQNSTFDRLERIDQLEA